MARRSPRPANISTVINNKNTNNAFSNTMDSNRNSHTHNNRRHINHLNVSAVNFPMASSPLEKAEWSWDDWSADDNDAESAEFDTNPGDALDPELSAWAVLPPSADRIPAADDLTNPPPANILTDDPPPAGFSDIDDDFTTDDEQDSSTSASPGGKKNRGQERSKGSLSLRARCSYAFAALALAPDSDSDPNPSDPAADSANSTGCVRPREKLTSAPRRHLPVSTAPKAEPQAGTQTGWRSRPSADPAPVKMWDGGPDVNNTSSGAQETRSPRRIISLSRALPTLTAPEGGKAVAPKGSVLGHLLPTPPTGCRTPANLCANPNKAPVKAATDATAVSEAAVAKGVNVVSPLSRPVSGITNPAPGSPRTYSRREISREVLIDEPTLASPRPFTRRPDSRAVNAIF
jgi:hypothetical protein